MRKHLSISFGQFSSAGRKAHNQDFHGAIVPDEPQLSTKGIAVAIADGISSSEVSQVAAETAVKGFLHDYYGTSDSWSVKKSAQRVLNATNSWLYAQTRNSPYRYDKDRGYICTFSALILKSNTAHIFHSGDTRIYHLTNRSLEQLTSDHRRVVSADLSYLTHALGIHDHLEAEYQSLTINEGDVFVLASDGVYEYLSERTIIDQIENEQGGLDQTARNLVDQAYEAGSEDNLTIQIIRINSLPDQKLDEVHRQTQQSTLPGRLNSGDRLDSYQILRELYISSRSCVYLAQDEFTKTKVVIKVPATEMHSNEAFLENFLMEEWIAHRLDNAHLLKAIKSRCKRSVLYTVSEYIEGKTLAQWMRDNPKPDLDTARDIATQLAQALQAMHRQEMVHQDLQPPNAMIDANGLVKVIDFGSTKVAGIVEITRTEQVVPGTIQYMAPEYFLGHTGTTQSDLFTLGVIVYQMLSGKLPYGNQIAKTSNARSQQRLQYRSLCANDNTIPGWIDYAISKAVHVNPQKRYQEISEFIYDLKHPNPDYLTKSKPPLLERNPVLFWQICCLILLCILVYQASR